jgi:spermidine synthase
MGLEIVWFRHFTLLLGPLRAVYSMLLTIVLLGIGTGSLIGSVLNRRTSRVAEWLIAAQALFVVLTLWGLTLPTTRDLSDSAVAVGERINVESAVARRWAELWFNITPISIEVFGPALLMGLMFPLGNRLVQCDERPVGARAGILYFSNTMGAVGGALATGFLFLPKFGIQRSGAILVTISWLSVVPVFLMARTALSVERTQRAVKWSRITPVFAGSLAVLVLTLLTWLQLPPSFLLSRALLRPTPDEQLIALDEGLNEVVAVTEFEGDGRRWLLTNGYPMSSTGPVEQRYMRALAHVPLLNMDAPQTVLVIGFGVGNTTHAATLYPSIRRVEVADLSRDILGYGRHFAESNRDVLRNPLVKVFVNDGRQHLQMQPPGSYDLITLEPPPIAHAGVGALYSTEFYRLARTRLKPSGFISQWLPAYQMPAATTLEVVRAFLDVFPNAVLLSGAQPNLLLIGANESIEIDPERLTRALEKAPDVRADLERVDLASVREIVGTFVASSQSLELATRGATAVTDDRPLQEYSVRSLVNFGIARVPSAIVDLTQVDRWCPRCFVGDHESPAADGLEMYMAIVGRAYMVPSTRSIDLSDPGARQMIEQSSYLRLLLRNAAGARNDMGLRLASQGRLDGAIDQFREALQLRPGFKAAEDNLAAMLAHRELTR